MAKKRSTLGMCKNYVLANQSDNLLWIQKEKKAPENKWSCKGVEKWVTATEGIHDDVGPTFWSCQYGHAEGIFLKHWYDQGRAIGSPVEVNYKPLNHSHICRPQLLLLWEDHQHALYMINMSE